jgi:hypothetical protein
MVMWRLLEGYLDCICGGTLFRVEVSVPDGRHIYRVLSCACPFPFVRYKGLFYMVYMAFYSLGFGGERKVAKNMAFGFW